MIMVIQWSSGNVADDRFVSLFPRDVSGWLCRKYFNKDLARTSFLVRVDYEKRVFWKGVVRLAATVKNYLELTF